MEKVTRATTCGEATRVGGDLAKRVIRVHAVNAAGKVLPMRTLRREQFIEWCVQLDLRGECLIISMSRRRSCSTNE